MDYSQLTINLVDLFFFVECYVCDHAAAENNTAGNLNPVPIAMAVTNTGTEFMYTAVAKHFKVGKHSFWKRILESSIDYVKKSVDKTNMTVTE